MPGEFPAIFVVEPLTDAHENPLTVENLESSIHMNRLTILE